MTINKGIEGRKMIVLRLMGGLGNQMSQVAFASVISKIYQEPIYIDNSSYKTYKIRPCSIQKYKLSNSFKFYNNEKKIIYYMMRISQKKYHVFNYIKTRKKQLGEKFYKRYVKKGHYYSFDSDFYGFPVCSKKNIDIYGYFLAEKYFRENKSDIKRLFELKKEYISYNTLEYEKQINESKITVAISVRLQDDYLKSKVNNVCSKEYFEKAIKKIEELLDKRDIDYYIFADDIKRAKDLKLDINATYVEGTSDVEGMYLLQKCNHFIISNSSFSWWGAYLGEYENKIVITPNHWMNNNKNYEAKYYEGMIKIKC